MTLEEFKKVWKKLLIDENISERELFRNLELSQPVWNRKINTGAIKYLELINILESLGYSINFQKESPTEKIKVQKSKEEYRTSLRLLFKEILKERNMSQAQLAKELGIKQQTINEKINKASWRYVDVLEVLEYLNYEVSIKRKR